jgi:hypothetical protein
MIMAYVLMQARAAGIGTSLTNATEAGWSKPCHICLDASATVAVTYRRLTCSGTDCSSWGCNEFVCCVWLTCMTNLRIQKMHRDIIIKILTWKTYMSWQWEAGHCFYAHQHTSWAPIPYLHGPVHVCWLPHCHKFHCHDCWEGNLL